MYNFRIFNCTRAFSIYNGFNIHIGALAKKYDD